MADKPDYYYRQSAVIPVRRGREGWEALMITTRSGKRWIFPKGIVEKELSPADSALKEAWEEAGIHGALALPEAVGFYAYEKWGGTCTVEVFVMLVGEVAESWPESQRSRRWATLSEAANLVAPPSLAAITEKIPLLLAGLSP